ncbi:S8 family peptidase [Mesorhizobium sp. ES1-6]|uniref:S8 family peptidase n=1 Tax=Mesorhizobium sp. ES1-6 TaxID=2876626 RepID=UPI001CCE1557|nr:S8 family peptidase [Mesorhizobium sp. ES1-6]MBZ9803364.1 S8 family peptidase [Mesorhizobium sp. ES1-6]
MADEQSRRPILNPVLRFTKDPRPEGITGRGKNRTGIRFERLDDQRSVLSDAFAGLNRRQEQLATAAGRTMIYASMFSDSRATTWTPTDIFNADRGASIVAPYRSGYLVEIETSRLGFYSSLMIAADVDRDMVDISRVEDVRAYDSNDVAHGIGIDRLWELAPEIGAGRAFTLWFMPYRDNASAEVVLQEIGRLRDEEVLGSLPTAPLLQLPALPVAPGEETGQRLRLVSSLTDRISFALRDYRARHRAKTGVIIRDRERLASILGSAAVFRLDPMPVIASTSPGEGTEPQRPLPASLASMPIVGVVDGGLTASSYQPAEAWRAQPLVPTGFADARHGNKVTSLIVQGHDWNNRLQLPSLYCRAGIVQVVPREGSGYFLDPDSLTPYLDVVMAAHPETKVWNLSLNQRTDCDLNQVSALGHDLAVLARKHGVLLVISTGNQPSGRMQPPADCEAALTVGGRLHLSDGAPGGKCPVSLTGPGPASMLKPETVHFSHVRTIGGVVSAGSSFSAALTSPLAAHTMAALREPSPDLVKALILHNADNPVYDIALGYGSPGESMPWNSPPGAVTLQWTASLKAGAAYYWELPIPAALRASGKLRGYGTLTAILDPHPLVSEIAGPNYFSARLETAVQFERDGKTHNLLGSLDTKKITEQEARELDHKWSPLRHHHKKFKGISFDGDNLRVYARIFTRDLYLYGYDHPDESPEMTVNFVLTIGTGWENDAIFNQMHASLGAFVENSTLDTSVEVET